MSVKHLAWYLEHNNHIVVTKIIEQHHIPEHARHRLKTSYPKQSRMLLQMTPTQQSVQQKPRGGKLDSENSWIKLTLTRTGMCLSRAVTHLLQIKERELDLVYRKVSYQRGSWTFKEFWEAGEGTIIHLINEKSLIMSLLQRKQPCMLGSKSSMMVIPDYK